MAWPIQLLVVWPARAVAFAVFLPLRMLYELVALVLRGLVRVTWGWLLYPGLRFLFKALWVVLSGLWDWALCPVGRGLAWLWTHACLPVLRLIWFGLRRLVIEIVNALQALWRTICVVVRHLVRPVRWFTRAALAPALRATAWVLVRAWRAIRWFSRVAVAPALRAMAWVLARAWRAIRAGLRALGRLLVLLAWHLVVRPGRWLVLAVLAPGWRATVATLAWAVRAVKVVLRLFVAVPLVWSWRTVAVPAGRATGRALRVLVVVPIAWCWRTLVIPTARAVRTVSRVLVVRPSRWVRRTVWQPIRETISNVARALTGRPVRHQRAKP